MKMPTNNQRRVSIIGHQNPDTDSICSALAYTWLKNGGSLEGDFEARRAGDINRETKFALEYFGVEPPRLCVDLSPQIKDIDIRKQAGIGCETSLIKAWNLMLDEEIDTLCITDEDNELKGVITVKDIAKGNMGLVDPGILATAETSYANILETLEAKLVVGDPEKRVTHGNICIGTSPEIMEDFISEGDIVLGSNRYETMLCAIDLGAGMLVVCCDASVPRTIISRAKETGCDIMVSPIETYAAARLITTAVPVRNHMKTDGIIKFNEETPIDYARKIMADVRIRYFPVLDSEGKYAGVVSRRNLLNLHRKQVILVDHNEKTQAVEGLEEADILEIIDHHRIGSLETVGPVYFRNEPVGCTATIVYSMYKEKGMKPDRSMAGLLVSAIISDTLLFRSPTATMFDRAAAEELAVIAGIDITDYAEKMFDAGSDLTGRTANDVFNSDFKTFSSGDIKFGVGQSIYMTEGSMAAAEELVAPYLGEAANDKQLMLLFYMFTNMKTQSTDLMYYGKYADEIIAEAFGIKPENGKIRLDGVVSRKKQLIPPLLAAIQKMQNL